MCREFAVSNCKPSILFMIRRIRVALANPKGTQANASKKRPNTDFWFTESRAFYPGILFAIDTQTGRMFQLRTEHGDSESLLVRDQNVFYRINDRLHVGRLQRTTIVAPQMLAENEAVPDMHWAFVSK